MLTATDALVIIVCVSAFGACMMLLNMRVSLHADRIAILERKLEEKKP